MFKIKIQLLFLFLVLSLLGGCSSSQQVTSLKNDGKITIDGRQSDWDNLTTIDGENIAFGFRNDDENIYLSMVTNDKSKIMKIMRGGFDVWIEPENSDYKIGVRYPDKADPSEMKFPGHDQQPPDMQNPDQKPGMRMQEDMDLAVYSALSKQKEIYILNEDEKVVKSYPIDGETFNAKVTFDKGSLCYEIKIPMGESLNISDGLRTAKNSKVNVEFLTGEVEERLNRERPDMDGEGMRPAGPPPGGGRGPGGPGGPGGKPDMGSRNQMDSKPLYYSFEVDLYK